MVSPAFIYVSRVGKHVVLCVHILALKVGPLLFHSTTLVLSQCTTYLPSMWLPCIFFSASFRCNACSFTEFFTPKSSTTKVKFIGRLLCFHSSGVFLEGWYPLGSRCFSMVLMCYPSCLGGSVHSLCYHYIYISVV